MGKFEIEFSKEAAKQYKKLPKGYQKLVDIALYRLSETSEIDLKHVEGEEDVYRIRVGKYRLLLRKFKEAILIFKISTRGDVYK